MEHAAAKPLILLVEDEPTSRLLMVRQLTRAGYEVEAVSNGREALAMLGGRFFPLLLTDWDMPEMDGLTLCKSVREMPLEGYVYIILLTARDGKAHIIEGLAAGADDYLTKPPDDNELRARLNTGRRIVHLEQALRATVSQVRLLSITDALTGAYNRRHLMERLPQEIARSWRYGRELSVVLCDVDHFKRVNDVHGHQAGDSVLIAFAALLLGSIRQDVDWVARYGGEEFLLVLPETAAADGANLAEKLRITVASQVFPVDGGTVSITASFGVAGCDRGTAVEPATVDALIGAADVCLYRSKEMGRNRVTGMTLTSAGITPEP
jgi:diguanylate cyclase (GGDEF)-like protein